MGWGRLMANDLNESKQQPPQVYEQEYSEDKLWAKIARFSAVAGRELIEKALWLYYAAQRPETPLWAKTVVFSALGYFIMPMDLIPDLTPAVGFSDDLGALGVAIATIAAYIDQGVKDQARDKLRDWFGETKS